MRKLVSHGYISYVFVQAIFYKKYSIKSDVWSFGCVMYEIWSLGYKPFEDIDGREVRTYIDFYYYDYNSIAIVTVTSLRYALSSVLFMFLVHKEDHKWIQTPTTSWLSQSYI